MEKIVDGETGLFGGGGFAMVFGPLSSGLSGESMHRTGKGK
jgi:hypothetical protein